ncbi:Proteinase inhibitor, propeptide [Arabidopsis thaliana]|uniref:Proteinase inhibitor, propeptide n=1 Tax=Arabidopsis thaliana TaxID=3702 RepID=B3H4B7_ARATH|nr:Proteinase inhibitor, propeptide [Arabidopsis thaliana]AEC09739.1 Proteinase inhibitor, propeptide [Arabidopsis thaliana]|eukprot:NP_001118480.1 Proteinase inhibitor, propeptide [Arabidopsis thaliana]
MTSQILLIFIAFSVFVVCSSRTLGPAPDNQQMKCYLVNVDFALYHGDCKQYQQLLKKVVHGRSAKDALVYCYKEVMSGFAAKLTAAEAEKLKGEKGISAIDVDHIFSMDVEPHSHGKGY